MWGTIDSVIITMIHIEIYLKCIKTYRVTDSDGHPEYILEEGKIYRATGKTPSGFHYWGGTERWLAMGFNEMSKVEVFCELKGQMQLVEELP